MSFLEQSDLKMDGFGPRRDMLNLDNDFIHLTTRKHLSFPQALGPTKVSSGHLYSSHSGGLLEPPRKSDDNHRDVSDLEFLMPG